MENSHAAPTWRPRFLQYNYMYDYRLNYYDDVIDYLDKKDRGIKSDIPKPQTWAERVLRTVKEWVARTFILNLDKKHVFFWFDPI